MVFSGKVPFQPPVEHFHEFSSQQPRKNDFPPQLVGAPRGWWFLQLCNGFLKLLYTGFVVVLLKEFLIWRVFYRHFCGFIG